MKSHRSFVNPFLVVALLLLVAGCAAPKYSKPREARFNKVTFKEMKGWRYNNHLAALNAFKKSCEVMLKRNRGQLISDLTNLGGQSKSWHTICNHALNGRLRTHNDARRFFEKWFVPYQVTSDADQPIGKFTGYYEIELSGSLRKNKKV